MGCFFSGPLQFGIADSIPRNVLLRRTIKGQRRALGPVRCADWLGSGFLFRKLIVIPEILRSEQSKAKSVRLEKRIFGSILCHLLLKGLLLFRIKTPKHRSSLAIEEEIPDKDYLSSSRRKGPSFRLTVLNQI